MSAACRCGRPAAQGPHCAECFAFAVARQRTAGFLQAEADRQRALGGVNAEAEGGGGKERCHATRPAPPRASNARGAHAPHGRRLLAAGGAREAGARRPLTKATSKETNVTNFSNRIDLSFNAERIARIAKEVQTIAKTKRDYVADRKSMGVAVVDGSLALRMEGMPQPDGTRGPDLFDLSRGALADLAGTLDVPTRYLERLVGRGHADLAASSLSTLLQREPKRHLVRTLGGRCRAVLSDSYRTLDNYDLLVMALREFNASGVEVWDLRHTEDGGSFSCIAVHPSVQEALRDDVPGAHTIRRLDGKPDVVFPGIKLSNSETGGGKWSASPFLFRAACRNGMTMTQAIGQVHLGRKREALGEIVYSDETKRLEDEVVIRKTREVIQATFDRERFKRTIEALNATTQVVIEKPTEAVEASIKLLGIPEEHKDAILEGLLTSRDRTQFGLAQAITALANPDHRAGKSDDLLDLLEAAGGKVLQATPREFATLVGAR